MTAPKIRTTAAAQKQEIADAIGDVLPGAARRIAAVTGCLPADVEVQRVSALVWVVRAPVPGRPSRMFTVQLSEPI